MANSVDPDQMPHSAASDLGLHCLQRPVCPNILGTTAVLFTSKDLYIDIQMHMFRC